MRAPWCEFTSFGAPPSWRATRRRRAAAKALPAPSPPASPSARSEQTSYEASSQSMAFHACIGTAPRCLCLLYRVSHGLRRPCDTSQPVERATEIRLCSDRRGILALAFLLIITMKDKNHSGSKPVLGARGILLRVSFLRCRQLDGKQHRPQRAKGRRQVCATKRRLASAADSHASL